MNPITLIIQEMACRMRLSRQFAIGVLVVTSYAPALGCDENSSRDGTTTSTTSTGDDSSSGTEDDGADGESMESGGEVSCGRAVDPGGTPRFGCTLPFDCGPDGGLEPFACGPLKAFTEEGCLRTRCVDDSNCESDQKCYREFDFEPDACVGSAISCTTGGDGTCMCGAPGDCQSTEGWCVRADDYPT